MLSKTPGGVKKSNAKKNQQLKVMISHKVKKFVNKSLKALISAKAVKFN